MAHRYLFGPQPKTAAGGDQPVPAGCVPTPTWPDVLERVDQTLVGRA